MFFFFSAIELGLIYSPLLLISIIPFAYNWYHFKKDNNTKPVFKNRKKKVLMKLN